MRKCRISETTKFDRPGWGKSGPFLLPPKQASRYFPHAGRLHSVPRDHALLPGVGAGGRCALSRWRLGWLPPALLLIAAAPNRPRRFARCSCDLQRGPSGHPLPVGSSAGDEPRRDGNPLWVSHKVSLERLGLLGRAWQTPDRWEPNDAFAVSSRA